MGILRKAILIYRHEQEVHDVAVSELQADDMTVYNWCREHRSLKRLLPKPVGKKSMNNGHWRWRLV